MKRSIIIVFVLLLVAGLGACSSTLQTTDLASTQPVMAADSEAFRNSIGMTFVKVSAGKFMMGSPDSEPDRYHDEALHQVTLTRDFLMQVTEVTQSQWREIMHDNPSAHEKCDECPVDHVSWHDAQEFVKRLNQKENTNKYRLPTEAEWEYATRAGASTAFSNGAITELKCGEDSNLWETGWYCGNSEEMTHPARSKGPNPWGLFDVYGNVWEWCQDYYSYYPNAPVTDPVGPKTGQVRVVRGGSWISYASLCRSASRGWNGPERRLPHVGFRLVKDL